MITISTFIGGAAIDWSSISQAIREQEARPAGTGPSGGGPMSSPARPYVEDHDMSIRETFEGYRQDPARKQWQERKRLSWREAKAARRQMYEAAAVEKQRRREQRMAERLLGRHDERNADFSRADSLRHARVHEPQHPINETVHVTDVSSAGDSASFTSYTRTGVKTSRATTISQTAYPAYQPRYLSTNMRTAKSSGYDTSQNRVNHIRREQK